MPYYTLPPTISRRLAYCWPAAPAARYLELVALACPTLLPSLETTRFVTDWRLCLRASQVKVSSTVDPRLPPHIRNKTLPRSVPRDRRVGCDVGGELASKQQNHPDATLPELTSCSTTTIMKVTFSAYQAVAEWKWDLPDDSDDTCGICRVEFEGTCSKCKYPGDDCPISMLMFPANLQQTNKQKWRQLT